MKATVVWTSPRPERTIAVAMRRCYSTKTIEDIEAELELKGAEYWKFLLTKALQDKSLDVLEHYAMTLVIDGAEEKQMNVLLRSHPYLRATKLSEKDWLVSLNARTLVELWHDEGVKPFAESIVAELDGKGVSPLFNSLAFGERTRAN